MNPERLWAKSHYGDGEPHPSMFLPQHLQDVYAAAERVLDATGDAQLLALGLNPAIYRDRFRRCVLLAAAVHDLGKANDHFQEMICGRRDVRTKPQGLRHEWVSLLMLQSLKPWLVRAVSRSEMDFEMIAWAVAGHHPAHDHQSPPRTCPPGAGVEIVFLSEHSDFPPILSWLASTFKLTGEWPAFGDRRRNLVGSANVFAALATWRKIALQSWEAMTPEDRRLVAAVKNCLVAADVAGSALPRELPNDDDRWQWITDSFAAMPRPGELEAVVADRAKKFTGSDRNPDRERFQANVAESTSAVTLVKAGCGTGKTLAAYMWAARNYANRRLFFCYPTTGTATEGFRDYLHEPDVNADLFHSRRDVDFEIILSTENDVKNAEKDAAVKLDSLDARATPIVACTVDTVLGVVQNNKRGMFAWPALAQSAFVFDEIHAYDDRLFGALLRFLRDVLGVPCLLMTASLPKPRETALTKTLAERGIVLPTISGPESLEILPRYHKLAADASRKADCAGVLRKL